MGQAQLIYHIERLDLLVLNRSLILLGNLEGGNDISVSYIIFNEVMKGKMFIKVLEYYRSEFAVHIRLGSR